MSANALIKSLLLLTRVFKAASLATAFPSESIREAVIVPLAALPLAMAVTSFNWNEKNNEYSFLDKANKFWELVINFKSKQRTLR